MSARVGDRPSPDAAAGDVLAAEPPRFDTTRAAAVAEELFGVSGAVSQLVSERDQNFRIDATDGSGWVLKVANAAERLDVVEMENAAMAHIALIDPTLPVPRVRSTRDGASVAWVEDGGRAHLVRMVSLLPGEHLAPEALTETMLEGLGATLARVGRVLRGFFHPAAGRVLQWDVKHTASLVALLPSLADPLERALVERTLKRWHETVAPRFATLRAQVVHSDLSLDNTLFATDGTVSGLVDFGDLVHTALLCDVSTGLVNVTAGRDDGLKAGRAFVRGYERVTPLEPEEWELLPVLVEARLATSLAIAAWRLERYPENADYITVDVARYRALLVELDRLGAERVRLGLAGEAATREESAALVERRARAFGPALQGLTYDRPIHMARAEGVWMFDAEGNRYLDAYNNVPVVGHSHPRVVEAIARQSRLLNTNMRYLHGAAVELAERLLATMPPEIDTCLFVNSGSEANDMAWRLIAHATGGEGGIVTDHAYHGVTTALIGLSPEEWRELEPPAHIARIPSPDGYRGVYRREEEGWAERYAAHFDEAVATLAERGIRPAAVFLDGALTSDGIHDPPPAYARELVRRAHLAGVRYVADEVQPGHARVGSALWSFQAAGIVPDVVTLGKPMGNGYPIGACLLRRDLAEALAEQTIYFSTFGGNPVACAAALAVLDVIEEERLQANALTTGAYLRSGLEALAAAHPAIGDVRGPGLLLGVELVADPESRTPAPALAHAVMNGLRERGVLVSRSGKAQNVLKLRPPLVFRCEHADLLLERLDDTLTAARV